MGRENNILKYLAAMVIVAVTGYVVLQVANPPAARVFSATPTAVCGNNICETGEYAVCTQDCPIGQQPQAQDTCGDNICGTSETPQGCPIDCTITSGLTCPSDGTTSFEVNVRDVLNESGFNRLAVTVKKIGPNDKLIDEDTSSSTASTIMKVPCTKATFTLIAYDDDNSGIDIYPAEVKRNAYDVINGAMAGGRIPVTINAKQQGTLATAVYDSSGSGSADHNITFAAGDTIPYTKLMVRQTEDDKAAANVMCMMNYTTSKFKKIEWTGDSPSGLTVKTCSIPATYSGDGGYEKAWCLFRDGQPLWLDGDSRTSDPDRAYFDITIHSYASTDPGQHNVTWRCIDRMKYWESDGVTWANNGVPSAEDADQTNLGIQAANEGIDEALMFYE